MEQKWSPCLYRWCWKGYQSAVYVCLSACLWVDMSVCVWACLSLWRHVCLCVDILVDMSVWVNLSICLGLYLAIDLQLPVCVGVQICPSVSVCLYFNCLSVRLWVYLSGIYMSLCVSVDIVCLSSIYLYLPGWRIYMCVGILFCLCVYILYSLFVIYLSLCLCVYPFIFHQ